jgi:NAD(P)-dependent dehydrogenase (short-subunit alcohol dehydrogenase family)
MARWQPPSPTSVASTASSPTRASRVHAPPRDMTDDQWDLVLEANVMGVVRALRAAIPEL